MISAAYVVLSDPLARAAYDQGRGVTARRAEGDTIELFLNAEEAAQGGMATISMRVPVRCPACDAGDPASCVRCGGRRTTDEIFSAWLAVPPGVADSAVLAPSVPLRGMVRPVSFRVRIRGAP
jgi:DnaJ-class molecular chaperone